MKGLLKSFVYAGSGIITCIRQERNMRVHLVCMIYMYSYLLIYDFFEVSRTQFAIIFIANAIVVMGELFNTAIEAVVDMAEEKFSEKYNRLAKISKDTAAGAVLVGAIFAVESVYLLVVHKADAYLGRIVKFLECQNRGACAAHEHSYSCRYFDLMLVVCDNYLNFASHFLFFTSSCFS